MNRTVSKQLKLEARCALKGKHGKLALIALLMTALNFVLGMLAMAATPGGSAILGMIIYIAFSLLVEVVYYILLAGLCRIYLDLCRDNPFKWTDLFSGFREHPEPVAIFAVFQYFLSFSFSQIGYWFLSCLFALIRYKEAGSFVLSLLITAVVAVTYIFLEISLSMVMFVHASDPWLSFREMLQDAWHLISGERLTFLWLQISFIGMYALGILSFGIGFLFVRPYTRTAECLFYRKISGQ